MVQVINQPSQGWLPGGANVSTVLQLSKEVPSRRSPVAHVSWARGSGTEAAPDTRATLFLIFTPFVLVDAEVAHLGERRVVIGRDRTDLNLRRRVIGQ